MNLIKNKNSLMIKNAILLILGLFLFAGGFYWFQWRPTKIKHDCSWVKMVKPAQPAYPALTEEELREKNMIKICPTSEPLVKTGENSNQLFEKNRVWTYYDLCSIDNGEIIKRYSVAQKAIPEKVNWRQATKEEYAFCLHDKGL